MESQTLLTELNKKENNADSLAREVLQDPALLPEVMAGISSSLVSRFKCAKILNTVSKTKPELLYPHFDFFASLLNSESTIVKWNAIDIVANLTAVDRKDKFGGIVDRYYALLNEGSLITAGHVVENSGKIARAKPELRKRITAEVLNVARIPLPTEECRNILAGKAIDTLKHYPELVVDRERIMAFAKSQLDSTRQATRKKAEAFLKRSDRPPDDSRLIAPCGMNCGICHSYLREQNQCSGCRTDDVKESPFLLKCIIRNCEVVKANLSKFCFECKAYPCRRLKQLDKRYRTQYAMSMIENLESIKTIGLKAFVEKEKARWRCPTCGGTICVHKGYCLECGPATARVTQA